MLVHIASCDKNVKTKQIEKNLKNLSLGQDSVINQASLELRPPFVMANGNTYEGQWVKGKDTREGQGKEIYKDGTIYVGQFKEDYKTGKGKLTFKSGYEYEGQFLNDCYHGYGKMKYDDGRRYEGLYEFGQAHGQGILMFEDGAKYVGEFFDG